MIGIAALLAGGGAAALGAWGSWRDRHAADGLWMALRDSVGAETEIYDPSMIADLPPVAQRYFARAIRPGTPLYRKAEIRMRGTFIMNGREYPMRAEQMIAPPHGFVWKARIGSGPMRFAGSDAYRAGDTSWTRFWLLGLVPLARAGGDADHALASVGRMLPEMIWVPASLLPQSGAAWREVGPDQAEVSVETDPDAAPVRLTLDAQGNVAEVAIMRWSNANPEGRYHLQPFGGRMLAHGQFGGFTVPTQVEVGNLFGTPGYEPFFRATVSDVRFVP